MKLKLLLALVLYGSSAYALQTAYWDNFLKAFNDFKSQMAVTCEAKKKLDNENSKLDEKLLLYENESIRPALWTVQKNKLKINKKSNQIDDITADDLFVAFLEIHGKEKKDIEPILQELAVTYFNKVIDSIKKAKILTKVYNELMSAPDDAPPSLSRQIGTLKTKFASKQVGPQGIQVSVSWKKQAENMMKAECKVCEREPNCEKFFEFREGAAVYFTEHAEETDLYPSSIKIYVEMKDDMFKIFDQNRALKKIENDYQILKVEQDNLKKRYDKRSKDILEFSNNWADCENRFDNFRQKAKTLKSAVEKAADALKDPAADGRILLNDLKKTMDGIYPPKPAPSKP